jgi:hypothetical protein
MTSATRLADSADMETMTKMKASIIIEARICTP